MRLPSRRAGLALLLGTPLISGLIGSLASPVRADYNYGYSKVEQQFVDPGNSGKGGSILDSTNPIDLMNKLRRGSAMDDATPPKDSIDAALKELEQLAKPQTATTAGVNGGPAVTPTPAAGSPQPAPAAKP